MTMSSLATALRAPMVANDDRPVPPAAPTLRLAWDAPGRGSAPVGAAARGEARLFLRRLGVGQAARQADLRAATTVPPALNLVAATRRLERAAQALGAPAAVRRIEDRRHLALAALRPLAEPATGDIGRLMIRRLVWLAGKRVDLRFETLALSLRFHALGRFLERSRRDGAALLAAALEAADHAGAAALGHLAGPLRHRLIEAEAAPLLLPAGPGAFLGRLRLVPGAAGGSPTLQAEAATWLHEDMFSLEQAAALAALRAAQARGGAPLVAAVPEACQALRFGAGCPPSGAPLPGAEGLLTRVAASVETLGAAVRIGALGLDEAAELAVAGTR